MMDIIYKIYHKCGLCLKTLLLDSDEIAGHLKSNHSITHKNYNAQYMTIKSSSKPSLKKEEEEKSKIKQKHDPSTSIKDDKEAEKTLFKKENKSLIHQQIQSLKDILVFKNGKIIYLNSFFMEKILKDLIKNRQMV